MLWVLFILIILLLQLRIIVCLEDICKKLDISFKDYNLIPVLKRLLKKKEKSDL